MWAQAVAAGPMTGAYLTMSLSDSVDQLMTEGQKAFADPHPADSGVYATHRTDKVLG